MIMGKRGLSMEKVIIHIILIGLLFVVFLSAMDAKMGSRGVKQQVLEKELALLIDASSGGMSFEVRRNNPSGLVDSVDVSNGRIFISVDGLRSVDGYPYFSKYDIGVESMDSKFIVRIK